MRPCEVLQLYKMIETFIGIIQERAIDFSRSIFIQLYMTEISISEQKATFVVSLMYHVFYFLFLA